MNVNYIVNEEFESLMNEIRTGSIQGYPFKKESEGRYAIQIDDDQRDIHVVYMVTFSPEGNTDEKIVSVSFKTKQGDYNDITGFGIQFRILATVSLIVKEVVAEHDPNIITFQPVKQESKINPRTGRRKNVGTNQRLDLYMNYVKDGAGEDFDAFVFGDGHKVNIEKRNPSFPLENGYQEPDIIQDVITQLSLYGGSYQTADTPSNDPNFIKFAITRWGGMFTQSQQNNKTTGSARRFVDWMLSIDDLEYIQGDKEAQPYEVPSQPQQRRDVPIQRIDNPQQSQAMVGTFEYFLQSEVYGNSNYEVLRPYFETMKTLNDFEELRTMADHRLYAARTDADRDRLQEIINAVDRIKNTYNVYARRYADDVNEVLNEVEENLLELLN